ncbi:hypothetical protein [Paenibacillus sp. Soil787]|uniref:hypothetical protein n=1 Tax=Paenibacillus sp. Soil787 TaxID=1736411 RepID=UPI0006F435FD|nr:hypothetical protein [Paenibacillus sp. Soil787]KRF39146.1 hypothetical protein ASG93_23595 [Paenibacillus sp. Soil787]
MACKCSTPKAARRNKIFTIKKIDMATLTRMKVTRVNQATQTIDGSAPCGSRFVIARVNGSVATTITLIQNVGSCEFTVFCVTRNGTVISGTEFTFAPRTFITKYVAPAGTYNVVVQCRVVFDAPGPCLVRTSLT